MRANEPNDIIYVNGVPVEYQHSKAAFDNMGEKQNLRKECDCLRSDNTTLRAKVEALSDAVTTVQRLLGTMRRYPLVAEVDACISEALAKLEGK